MKENEWIFEYEGVSIKMQTTSDVFSPHGIDKGTLAMLSFVNFNKFQHVLDLGCGSGIVGIFASKFIGCENVVMVDKSAKAIECSKLNCEINQCQGIQVLLSDGFEKIGEKKFDLILSNPPYHEDFSVPKKFIEDGFQKLEDGGCIYMVTKRKEWYKNKLISVFGGVKIWEKDGYYIFMAQKRTLYKKKDSSLQKVMSKKIRRKMDKRGKKNAK